MSAMSRRKGANGERELCAQLHALVGVRFVRRLDQVRSGGHDLEPEANDCSAAACVLRGFAIEAKRRARITDADVARWWAEEAVPQAEAVGLVPMLAYRPDRGSWRVVLPLTALAAGVPAVPATLRLVDAIGVLVGTVPTNPTRS